MSSEKAHKEKKPRELLDEKAKKWVRCEMRAPNPVYLNVRGGRKVNLYGSISSHSLYFTIRRSGAISTEVGRELSTIKFSMSKINAQRLDNPYGGQHFCTQEDMFVKSTR